MGTGGTLTLAQAIGLRWCNPAAVSGALAVYIFNQLVLKKAGIPVIGFFLKCYLNDLACPLFYLGVCQILLIWAGREITSFIKLLILCMSAGVLWECAGPLVRGNLIADPWDLFCYFAGTCIYYLIMRICLRQEAVGFQDGT